MNLYRVERTIINYVIAHDEVDAVECIASHTIDDLEFKTKVNIATEELVYNDKKMISMLVEHMLQIF